MGEWRLSVPKYLVISSTFDTLQIFEFDPARVEQVCGRDVGPIGSRLTPLLWVEALQRSPFS
jgi:hypothetical protein